jgi:hypothetical protein
MGLLLYHTLVSVALYILFFSFVGSGRDLSPLGTSATN